MRLLIIFTTTLLFTITSFAQTELTLEDAIMGRAKGLYPERLSNMNWSGDGTSIQFASPDGKYMEVISLDGKIIDKGMTAESIGIGTGIKLDRMPRLKFLDKETFTFSQKGKHYKYNTASATGKLIATTPEGAENVDFDAASGKMAYTMENNLYVMNGTADPIQVTKFENKNIVSGQAIARYEFGIGKGTFWSPNNNLLAFYQKDETEVTDYPILDISTTPGTLKNVKYPMAGQGSESAKVGVYNTKTKKTIYLDVSGPKDQYLTNVGWGPEEKYVYVAVLNRGQDFMQLNKYEAESGKFVKTLFEEKHEKWVEPEKPIYFMEGNKKEFLWMSERDGFMHVYKYTTKGKLKGQITKGRWVVTQILGTSKDGNTLFVKGTDESGLNMYAYAVDMKTGRKTQLSKKDGQHNYILSPNKDYLIDVYSNLETPYVAEVVDMSGKLIQTIRTSKNPLDGHTLGTTELIKVKADDGTTLHGRIMKPSHFDATKKYPVLVYVYGGPHAQMVSNRWLAGAPLWMHYMAEKGYIIFTLDNRGSKNRGFEFENIIHRQLGDVEIKDQLAGVKYLKSLPYVDSDRMAVHGWSYGGFMTTSLMLREPGTFKVGVAGGPVTDWKFYEIMYGERYMDTPSENEAGYAKASLLNKADQLDGDLLLIHGTVDDVVVMQHNLALVQKFVEAGKLIDFMPYPGHPHNVRGKDRIHLMNKVLTYVEEKLRVEN